jgi:hypothetical protein
MKPPKHAIIASTWTHNCQSALTLPLIPHGLVDRGFERIGRTNSLEPTQSAHC